MFGLALIAELATGEMKFQMEFFVDLFCFEEFEAHLCWKQDSQSVSVSSMAAQIIYIWIPSQQDGIQASLLWKDTPFQAGFL